MVENFAKWPSERGQPAKVRSSEGCEGYGVPVTVDQWYDFHEFGCHLGNVSLGKDDGSADEQAFIAKARSLIAQQLGVEGFQEISKTE